MASGENGGIHSKFQERLRRMRISRNRVQQEEDEFLKNKVEEIHKAVEKNHLDNVRLFSERSQSLVGSDAGEGNHGSSSQQSFGTKENGPVKTHFVRNASFSIEEMVDNEEENLSKKDFDVKKEETILLDDSIEEDEFVRGVLSDIKRTASDREVTLKKGTEEKEEVKNSYVSYDDMRKNRVNVLTDSERDVELGKIESDLVHKIQYDFEDKLDELEVLEGRLYYLFSLEKNAVVMEEINSLKLKIQQFIVDLNDIVDQYNAYKRNYYMDHVVEIDDHVIVDDLIDYRILLDNMDDEKKFTSGYKKLKEFEKLYGHLSGIRLEVSRLKEETMRKASLFGDRDRELKQMNKDLLDASKFNQSCSEELERQNRYFNGLMKDISRINREEYVTTHIKGLGEMAAMSFRYLGLLLLNPLKGTLPGIGIQTLAAKEMVVNLYRNLDIEKVKHIRYYATDYEREINGKLNDIEYTSALIDDAISNVDDLLSSFMLKYNSSIPYYDDTLNKIYSIRKVVLRNQNKVNKIRNHLKMGKKLNEEKLMRVKELNEHH